MHFMLDANILHAEKYGTGARITAFLSAASAVGYKVYVPKLVLEEISANYSRCLASHAQKVHDSLAGLTRFLIRDFQSPLKQFDLEVETTVFKNTLSARLATADSVILEYPSASHEDLVKRATARRKPFNAKGSGYRDALIWQTVLDLAMQVDEDIVLVSSDKDFQDAHGNLHGDLIEDLEGLGLPKTKVTLSTKLSDLVEKHVRPNLGSVPWERPLYMLAQRGLNLEDSIGQIIQDACAGLEREPPQLGLRWEYESPTLEWVEDVSNLTVKDIREMSSDRILVNIEARIHGQFGVFVYKPDFYIIDDSRLTVNEFNWTDHYVWAGIDLPLHCVLDLVVDTSNPEQNEVQDVSVELQPIK